MRRMAIVIVLGSLVTPLLAQQESQLLIPLTTPDGKRAPNVGVGDFGTNRRRLEHWLEMLTREVGPTG